MSLGRRQLRRGLSTRPTEVKNFIADVKAISDLTNSVEYSQRGSRYVYFSVSIKMIPAEEIDEEFVKKLQYIIDEIKEIAQRNRVDLGRIEELTSQDIFYLKFTVKS